LAGVEEEPPGVDLRIFKIVDDLVVAQWAMQDRAKCPGG